MDTRPQPTDNEDALDHLLGRARQFILERLTFLTVHFASTALTPRVLAYLTRRALLPAEAALRRAILLIAATLPTPAPRAAAPATKPRSASAPSTTTHARAPVFRMREPHPRPKPTAKTDYFPEALMPRITLLTDAALRARATPITPAPANPPRDPVTRFQRRLQALQSAFENPVREAERWLRRCAGKPSDKSPLTPGRIPGATKANGETACTLLRDLTDALAIPLPNTS